MAEATFKPSINKHNDAKAQVPLHTASLVQSNSLGAFSFGGKTSSYHQKYALKKAYQKIN